MEQSIKVLRDNVESMPKELSKEEFLTKGLERVINKESFLEHLQKAKDSKQRLAFLNLVEPTMAKANIELDILTDSGELRKGYLKAFEYGENRDLFYLLVTQDKDKLLISGYPISKEKEIKRILKKAKSITFKEGVAFEEITNRPELNKSSTLKTDSTTETIKMQFKNKALQKSDFIYYKPYERDNLVHSKSEILDLEDTLRYTKEHFDNVESSLRDYHYAHKIAQELLDKRGGGKYNELDSAAKQELMKEAVKIRENRVKQEAPALKEKYAKEIQELESKLQAFKEQNKEAKEQYLKTYQAEIKDYETQEAIRKEQYIQQQEKEREALRKKREQELKEYGVEIDEDYVEDLITNGGYTHQDIQHIKNKAKEGNTIARQILENFDTTHSGNGYNGYSMSNNAIEAYNNGLMPLNKWGKQEADELSDLLGVKVGIAQLKRFLKDYGERGYHHTSRFYNKTPFYSIAEAFQNIDKKELDEYFRKK